MNERQKIEERLRRKEQELQGLEEKMRTGRVYVQALRDVLKLLSNDSDEEDVAESVPRPGSAVAQARNVILKRGRPVHVNDLLQAQGKDLSRESRASLTSSLAAYVRRGEIFTRPAPNTFGLVELGHDSVEVEAAQPPSGFGRQPPPIVPSPPPVTRLSKSVAEADDDIPF